MTDHPSAAPPRAARAARPDGEGSRERLLHAALTLFAQRGFASTSTRQIAEAAGTNLAAIKYYFGDKAGLYRAAFFDLQSTPEEEIRRGGETLGLREALRSLYLGYLQPLQQGETTTLCMKLHMREMLEPTGLWREEIEQHIRPLHEALVQVLCRHLGAPHTDDEIERLALCVAALGMHLYVGRDITDALAPALVDAPGALDRWLDALVMYAEAMVAAERRRRATPRPG